mmetsp:Transcript_115727/g.247367  ORF Transcript_115727/g.247367 Transcript_115727/m.247367 type:complete len:662 (+) Transcript_115727:23-2008(+)
MLGPGEEVIDAEGDGERSPLVPAAALSAATADLASSRFLVRRCRSDVGPCTGEVGPEPWQQLSLGRRAAHLSVASKVRSAARADDLLKEENCTTKRRSPDVDGDLSDGDGVASLTSTERMGASERLSESTTAPPSHSGRGGAKGQRWAGCREMPWQRNARRFYPWLFPCSALIVLLAVGPSFLLLAHLLSRRGWDALVRAILSVPVRAAVTAWIVSLAVPVAVYAYHFLRLRGTSEMPPTPDDAPLTHVVVVCTYREPAEVLCRTFESIAAQTGLQRQPIAVFAAEARDENWRENYAAVQECCGDGIGRLLCTEHLLAEGEVAGKSSNENFAARELYNLLVEDQGLDPFEVIVTIADSDSLLSSSYLAHVEAAFRAQPDGRRLIYNGPLNTYRNFADAGLLIQCLEMMRCHRDTFRSPFEVPYPYSNYSLTLGFAAEIGFWTPDSMPEDIHTANKAMVNNFGSRTTVPIPPIICNDLVPDLGSRYTQARRHQWGSVAELAWQLALYTDTGLNFPSWWAVFSSEAARGGSVLHMVGYLSGSLFGLASTVVVAWHWSSLPDQLRLYAQLALVAGLWRWLWFWIAELTLWHTLLRDFPIRRPSLLNWLALIVFMPLLSVVGDVVFYMVPTLHGLFHATFKGELAYVTAPKGMEFAAKSEPLMMG